MASFRSIHYLHYGKCTLLSAPTVARKMGSAIMSYFIVVTMATIVTMVTIATMIAIDN